jgi:predicted methyltransferase
MNHNMIFSHYQTQPLIKNDHPDSMELSTDLGLSTLIVEKKPGGWQFPNGKTLTDHQVQIITENTNNCFLLHDDGLRKAEVFSHRTNRYYSLMPTPKAPTMLVSGIPMHRIKDTTPDEDTKQKIHALGKPYGKILDTATGLGYTAIQAAKTAEQVVTIEFDPAVHQICRMNPWSKELFTHPRIYHLIGDSADLAPIFDDGVFNAIIHDPPMFSMAGHLYSQNLYHTFYRILARGGRLFHYIGNPDSRLGASVGRGVVDRLKKAGFSVKAKEQAFGVLAKK